MSKPEADFYRDLYNAAPCGLLSTLPDGEIVEVNDTFVEWTGFAAADIVGGKFQDLLTPENRTFYEIHLAPLLRLHGELREVAVDLLEVSGEVLPVLLNSVAQVNAEGDPLMTHTSVFEATYRREYERDLLVAKEQAQTLARTLQDTLIPPAPPRIPNIEIGVAYRPAGVGDEVGGDFYDVFQVGSGDWVVTLGDVCGKGAAAATITALARYTVRAVAVSNEAPSAILGLLNEALLLQSTDRFCTAVCARLSVSDTGNRATISCGGHAMPIKLDEAGRVVGGNPGGGTLLGVFEDVDLTDVIIDLKPGESLVFYTDGVTEARSGTDYFGEDRLREYLSQHVRDDADVIANGLAAEVVAFQNDRPRDDIAIVVLKSPLDPGGIAPIQL